MLLFWSCATPIPPLHISGAGSADTGGTEANDSAAPETGLDSAGCPLTGTDLDWDNFGRQFFVTWCANCHNEADPGPGVPDDMIFDEESYVWVMSERILVRVVEASAASAPPMPPPEDAYSQEVDLRELSMQKSIDIAKLGEWLNCGEPSY